METLNINELIDLSLNLVFYFCIGSFGAFFKVLYESMVVENYKIRIGKVIVGGGTAAIICVGLNYNFLHQYNIGTRFLLGAILGILGFEIFGKLRDINGIKHFLNDVSDIRKGLRGEKIDIEEPKKEKKKDEEDGDNPPSCSCK